MVDVVSVETLGFLEAVQVQLPHKTGEAGGFEAVQGQKLLFDAILVDHDPVALVVPGDGLGVVVVNHSPQFYREDVCSQ